MSGPNSREYYYVESCPAQHECSRSSWNNAKIWGWTELEARQQLDKHLGNSSLHKSVCDKDRKILVEDANLVADVHHFEKKGKHDSAGSSDGQQRLAIGAGDSDGHQRLGTGAGSSDGQRRLAIAVGNQQDETPEFSDMQMRQAELDQQDHVGGVILRQVEFDSIIDSVTRASTCARSAQRLAASAAKAFSDECANLDAVIAHLNRIKENAELDMRI